MSLGGFGGVHSPLAPPTEDTLLGVTLDAGAELEVPVPAGQRSFFMPVNGSAALDGVDFALDGLGAAFPPISAEATTHRLTAKGGAAKVAVFIGEPLQQPISADGPMAFASQRNLMAATAALRRGDLGRL